MYLFGGLNKMYEPRKENYSMDSCLSIKSKQEKGTLASLVNSGLGKITLRTLTGLYFLTSVGCKTFEDYTINGIQPISPNSAQTTSIAGSTPMKKEKKGWLKEHWYSIPLGIIVILLFSGGGGGGGGDVSGGIEGSGNPG